MKNFFRISFPRIAYPSFPRSAWERISSRGKRQNVGWVERSETQQHKNDGFHCILPILPITESFIAVGRNKAVRRQHERTFPAISRYCRKQAIPLALHRVYSGLRRLIAFRQGLPRRAWQPSAWALVFLLSFAAPVPAVVEYHPFDDPVKEEAYQTLISELRCLVCQNQTIADSNADLAKDLRQQVYDMLQRGKSREDVVDFMTERYGDFVMYRPAFNAKTGLLWLGPIAFLLIGIIAVVMLAKNKKTAEKPVLDQQQQRELDRLLQKGEED